MRTIFEILKKWLPLAIATTGLCGLVYVSLQQNLRMGANDPQIQMAEEATNNLNGGASIESLIPDSKVEIANSLVPFLMVLDESGKTLASSATLHGGVPTYPIDVNAHSSLKAENRVTWEPESGVRLATVIVRYNKGFVIAGRSLREVENRIEQMGLFSGAALVAILATTLVVISLGELLGRKKGV